MPIPVGNVLERPLGGIYRESPLLVALRDRERSADGCGGCFYARLCGGGLRCLSYALTGDPFGKDPGCWVQSVSAIDGPVNSGPGNIRKACMGEG